MSQTMHRRSWTIVLGAIATWLFGSIERPTSP